MGFIIGHEGVNVARSSQMTGTCTPPPPGPQRAVCPHASLSCVVGLQNLFTPRCGRSGTGFRSNAACVSLIMCDVSPTVRCPSLLKLVRVVRVVRLRVSCGLFGAGIIDYVVVVWSEAAQKAMKEKYTK